MGLFTTLINQQITKKKMPNSHSSLPLYIILFLTLNILSSHVFSLEREQIDQLSTYATKKNYLPNIPGLYQTEHTPKGPNLSWSNIVIVMLTYNNNMADKLIQAQFDTWVRRIEDKGLDIVVVTDKVDTRKSSDVVPDLRNIKPAVHVYRSSAPNEGNRVRSKTVDAFTFCHAKFGNNPDKLYYLKVDPDQFLLVERLASFLEEVHQATYPQPANFGKVNCNNDVICYPMGGLYGISIAGLDHWVQYLQEHPSVYDDFVPSKVVQDRNLVLHEDFFTSYVFFKSTGYPTITDSRIGLINMNPISINRKSKAPPEVISFHPIKSVHDIYILDKIFYNSKGDIRSTSVATDLFSKFQDMFDFTKMVWNYELGEMVMPKKN